MEGIGLCAKPIIDILVVVSNITKVDLSNAAMERLGYVVNGEHGLLLRRFFQKHNAFHVHAYEQGNKEIARYINFRDWLINHLEDRLAYQQLKKHLSQTFSDDIASYCMGKNDFVAIIDEKAVWDGIRAVKALMPVEWAYIKTCREKDISLRFLDDHSSPIINVF